MPERRKKFHDFAIQSILFKGRADWYFCFLKAEKIAQVLALLLPSASAEGKQMLYDLSRSAAHLPQEIAHFAAGEVDLSFVLADIFSLLSSARLCSVHGGLSTENAMVIAKEYEQIAEKLQGGGQISPFVSAEDFSVPETPLLDPATPLPAARPLKDIHKGHIEGHKGQNARAAEILSFIKEKGQASIKDIAGAVKGCSEKTIQRELGSLIERGLIRREGERRWSIYRPI